MATIPDEQSLGQLPTPQPSLATSPVPYQGPAEAMAEVGQTITRISEKAMQVQRVAQLTDAMSGATEELGAAEIAARRDQNFDTAATRFKDLSRDIESKYGEGIEDPMMRQLFQNQFRQTATHKFLDVTVSAAKQQADYNKGALLGRVTQLATDRATAENETGRLIADKNMNDLVDFNVAHGFITDVEGQSYKKHYLQRGDWAQGLHDIELTPQATMAKLMSDPNYLPNLDEVKREQLTRSAEIRQNQLLAQKAKQDKEAQQQAGDDLMAKLGKGQLRTQDVVSSILPWHDKNMLLNELHTRAKEALEAPIHTLPSVELDLERRTSLPPTDPQAITTMGPIMAARQAQQLSVPSFDRLEKRLQDNRTEDGQKWGQAKRAFLDSVKGQITDANPIQGKMDREGDQKFYEFSYDVDRQAAYLRTQKHEDPYTLFDPSNPNYMGRPEALTRFQKSVNQSSQTITTNASRAGPKPLVSPGDMMRQPSESYFAWRQRVWGVPPPAGQQ